MASLALTGAGFLHDLAGAAGCGLRPAAAGFRKIRGRLAPQTPIRLGGGLAGVGFAVFRDAENKPAMRP